MDHGTAEEGSSCGRVPSLVFVVRAHVYGVYSVSGWVLSAARCGPCLLRDDDDGFSQSEALSLSIYRLAKKINFGHVLQQNIWFSSGK